MTTEHWITIVLITTSFIAQLIAPTLSALVMSRMSQPKPTPQANQPKKRSQSSGGWLSRFIQSPWFVWGQLLIIPLNLWALSREFAETGPITHSSILAISITVGGIFLSLVNTRFSLQSKMINTNTDAIIDLSHFVG
jgi:hypothetical protein